MTHGATPDTPVVVHPLPVPENKNQEMIIGPLVGLIVAVFLYFNTHLLTVVIIGIATAVAMIVSIKAPSQMGQFRERFGQISLTLSGGRLTYSSPVGVPRVIAEAGQGGRVERVKLLNRWGSNVDKSKPLVHWVWKDAAGRTRLRMAEGAWPIDQLNGLREAVGYPISDAPLITSLFGRGKPPKGGGPSGFGGPPGPSGFGGPPGPTLPGGPPPSNGSGSRLPGIPGS